MSVDTAIPQPRADYNRLFIVGRFGEEMDLVSAAMSVDPLPGRVLLAMDAPRESRGSFALGLEAENNMRSDVGTVLASGADDVLPGERLTILPANGKSFARVSYRTFNHVGRLIWLGVDSMTDDVIERPLEETVVCKVSGMGIEPFRDWCLIRRNATVGKVGELYLPDEVKFRDSTARLIAKGVAADDAARRTLELGADYIYRQSSVIVDIDVDDWETYGYEGEMSDYAFIRSANLYARVWL